MSSSPNQTMKEVDSLPVQASTYVSVDKSRSTSPFTATSTDSSSSSDGAARSTMLPNEVADIEKLELKHNHKQDAPMEKNISSSSNKNDNSNIKKKKKGQLRAKAMKDYDKRHDMDIPDSKYWKVMRKAYFRSKGDTDKSYDYDLREFLSENGPCGALREFEVKYGPYGRGVYAKKSIPQGAHVWITELSGRFLTLSQFENFLSLIPPNMQRDVVEWAYVYYQPEDYSDSQNTNNIACVTLDLDAGSMINHGGPDVPEEGYYNCHPTNLEEIKVPWESDSDDSSTDSDSDSESEDDNDDMQSRLVAERDIKAGEELLVDYTRFHDHNLNNVEKMKRNLDKNGDDTARYFEEIWEKIMEQKAYFGVAK